MISRNSFTIQRALCGKTCRLTVLIAVALSIFGGPSEAAVKPSDYDAMVIALSDQAKANTGLAGGLGACIAMAVVRKPNNPTCFSKPAHAWLDAIQVSTVMLKDVNADQPPAACRKALTAWVNEVNRSIAGVTIFWKAARTRKITSDNLPGWDRVRAAAISTAGARLARACRPGP